VRTVTGFRQAKQKNKAAIVTAGDDTRRE